MTTHDPDASPATPDHFSPAGFRLDGRHILVTGAGRGLGRAIALSAAAFGATVSLVARTAPQLEDTARAAEPLDGTCVPLAWDLTGAEAVPGLLGAVRAQGPLDGVVHAAGVQHRVDALDVAPEDFRRVMTLNLEVPYFLSAAIAREQRERGARGSHVFIASLNSSIGRPTCSPYVASKTGIVGVTRAFSTEWSPHGIRANAIGPGFYRTALTEDLLTTEAGMSSVMSRIPMGRLGRPAELGGAAVYLLSDASAYVSGQVLNVDGGWLAA